MGACTCTGELRRGRWLSGSLDCRHQQLHGSGLPQAAAAGHALHGPVRLHKGSLGAQKRTMVSAWIQPRKWKSLQKATARAGPSC